MPLGALIIVIDTLARSRVGKWRTARLDDRRDGDHDTCGDDTGDSWARGRDVTSTPTTMLANLWRCRGRLLGARRGAVITHDLLPGTADRRCWLDFGLRYFPPDLRADAVGREASKLRPAKAEVIE